MTQDTNLSMIEDSSTWRVRPCVSPRVAIEAPRMFSSFPRALRELFQNAYRAAAKRVDVSWNPKISTLEIKDDGPGIIDPQILLDAGASGWDQERVIEPAGLGFFSLFNPAYVEWVQISSMGAGNWHMRFTPSDVRRAVEAGEDETKWIQVDKLMEMDGSHGLSIQLGVNLKEIPWINQDMIVEARAQYPYGVFYTEGDKTVELLPRTFGSGLIAIETPVGKVEWEMPYAEGYRHGRASWEYVPFFSNHLTRALEAAAQVHPLSALAEIAAHSLNIWYVDPACGVRPQLPERSELIDDDALRSATQVVVDCVVSDMLARAKEDFRTAPARFVSGQSGQAPYSRWLERGKFSQVVLKCVGYAMVEQQSSEVWIETLDEESWLPHLASTLIYSRTAQIVGDEHLAATLNLIGREVAYEQGAPIPEIRMSGCRTDSEACPFVSLADHIEVEGIGAIPFLIAEQKENADTSVRIIFVGAAEACVQWLHQEAWAIGYLFVANENIEWASRDGDDMSFERDQALEDVSTGIGRAWSSELGAAMQEYYDLQRVITFMEEAERKIESAGRYLHKHRNPKTNLCHHSLSGVQARLKYVLEIVKEARTRSVPHSLFTESTE